MIQPCYPRLYLGIQTVSRRLSQRMARMDINLKKLCLQNQKELLWLVLSDEIICLMSPS